MSFVIQNIVHDETGDILCEYCQETVQPVIDELILDMDLLYHKKCFDEHVNDTLESRTRKSEKES